MSDSFDPTEVKLPAEISKHNGYYDSEVFHQRYLERKAEVQARYAIEKVLGKRRKDGTPNRKKLRNRHKRMIAMYVNGVSPNEIALHFDVSQRCVLGVVQDPLAAQWIEEFEEGHKDEFNKMFPLINDAIREGLENPSIKTKMSAIDRWHKLHKTINGEEGTESGSAKTKEITAARFRFIDKVREIAEKNGVLEAEVVTVTETTE
jgi:hypothetical protein